MSMDLEPCRAEHVPALTAFLSEVDLTLSGLDVPSVRLWVERDELGAIVGSTGYEISDEGQHALIRSVAVSPAQRSRGRGSDLARFALARASLEGRPRPGCSVGDRGRSGRAWDLSPRIATSSA